MISTTQMSLGPAWTIPNSIVGAAGGTAVLVTNTGSGLVFYVLTSGTALPVVPVDAGHRLFPFGRVADPTFSLEIREGERLFLAAAEAGATVTVTVGES
ncbi:hypothetical protein [Roseovarius sp. MBR-6]|jgi:hypothetical protein|uniref:hypothetical protein n=1 Tax=Roseovarius sp. MBR-6 TaxID=3156459 RepID=UPI0033986681